VTESGFLISKEKRRDFYEFMDKSYRELGRRLTIAEMNIQELRRGTDSIKGASFGYYEADRFDLLLRGYFSQENVLRLDQIINRQFANKIYRPLALSTAIASTILAISAAVVATPILALPFALTALFSLYYWRLQGEKG